MSTSKQYDYIIVGAGIIGLALALKLTRRFSNPKILIIEKEPAVGLHASGRNSGVLHAGFYYSADSLKAQLCVKGNKELRAYCKEKSLPLNECGKLVVASYESELPALRELHRRGIVNGAQVELISEADARKLEPNVHTCGEALYSPHTATSDPARVAQTLKSDLEKVGVEILCDCRFLRHQDNVIFTSQGTFEAGKLINCAGLYADKIAQQFGFGMNYTIIPFKGLYLKYKKNKSDVRMNIYPVPNPKYPFLGVHFTKTVDGTIKIGPTAIPALWRENYAGLKGFDLGEFFDIGMWESRLFLSNAFNFRTLALTEVRKYWRSYLIRLSQLLIPNIDPHGFGDFAPPGIRSQLLNVKTKELVQDFIVEGDTKSVHVLNAVSPGWTCSLPFADYIIDTFLHA
ncbi:MAG: L-2-hydroxyglutarate oxidase [Deltaproteobacteria bacterium]|nr:L-2-hydroxyglutarate oxidase [Deltaproteobacteria bacterium]